TLGKTGAGPEGLPHSIIVTAEGIDGEVPPTLDSSPSVAPAIGDSDGIYIEEKPSPLKSGRKPAAKATTGKKSIGKDGTAPFIAKKGALSEQQAGAVRTGRKVLQTRKKK
ncbi:MAG TPA: hypothetical protein VK901_11540, partial [Nitrospiraceae bacterium]|nr:hypothetical protein [Nitrospiraceae bacterium]